MEDNKGDKSESKEDIHNIHFKMHRNIDINLHVDSISDLFKQEAKDIYAMDVPKDAAGFADTDNIFKIISETGEAVAIHEKIREDNKLSKIVVIDGNELPDDSKIILSQHVEGTGITVGDYILIAQENRRTDILRLMFKLGIKKGVDRVTMHYGNIEGNIGVPPKEIIVKTDYDDDEL